MSPKPQQTNPIKALLDRYRTVRAETLLLTAPLSPEDMMVQSCSEASPAKWHLAHTTWFFEVLVLAEFLPNYRAFHPDFHWLFNSYYNSLGKQPEKNLRPSFSRPSLAEVHAYRVHVDSAIAHLLDQHPAAETIDRIILGLNHEQQHQELIATDIKHALFTNPLHPAYRGNSAASDDAPAAPLSWLDFSPGLIKIGALPDPASFAYDNESPRHAVYLAPYSLATRPITCAEYLSFISDDAYDRPELWLSDGWIAVREFGWQAPLYWQRTSDGWRIYTLDGWRPIEALSATPVCHLSFFEADAYARWAGYRLPTEFEWEHAAAEASPAPANLLESGSLHPTRAPARPGLQQVFGDVWEWTASPYTGYPGYRAASGPLGEYNGKFMSSQMVLRGGSCVTPATHIRATYRNFFAPTTRWQVSGLRFARDLSRDAQK
jgi:ergothioneine biosynthesis protein EgtB